MYMLWVKAGIFGSWLNLIKGRSINGVAEVAGQETWWLGTYEQAHRHLGGFRATSSFREM